MDTKTTFLNSVSDEQQGFFFAHEFSSNLKDLLQDELTINQFILFNQWKEDQAAQKESSSSDSQMNKLNNIETLLGQIATRLDKVEQKNEHVQAASPIQPISDDLDSQLEKMTTKLDGIEDKYQKIMVLVEDGKLTKQVLDRLTEFEKLFEKVAERLDKMEKKLENAVVDRGMCPDPWYYGHISREEAEKLLKKGREGDFMVRENKIPGLLSISLKSSDAIKHFKVQAIDNQLQIGNSKFDSMKDLIAAYQSKPILTNGPNGTENFLFVRPLPKV